MCGLSGVIFAAGVDPTRALNKFESLSHLASQRGKDTSGCFFLYQDRDTNEIFGEVIKYDGPLSGLFCSPPYLRLRKILQLKNIRLKCVVSHTRMATVGSTEQTTENQPLVLDREVLFFNGILIDKTLDRSSLYKDDTKNDGWRLFSTFDLNSFTESGIINIVRFRGSDGYLDCYTNNGDLFYTNNDTGLFMSSDDAFLRQVFPDTFIQPFRRCITYSFDLGGITNLVMQNVSSCLPAVINQSRQLLSVANAERLKSLMDCASRSVLRCRRCGSPESLESDLICSRCKGHGFILKGSPLEFDNLLEAAVRTGKPILLGLSGGRDSSYVVTRLVEEHSITNLLTYTFDWGVNTPYARTNVSHLCGRYGIRNLLVAADIREKRRNVCAVLNAYCTSPVAALIPLLMAGDKQFISTARYLSGQHGTGLEVFGFNPFEKTRFKEELVVDGLWPRDDSGSYGEDLPVRQQIRLGLGYSSIIARYPRYWNASLLDAAKGFLNYYRSGVKRLNYFDYFQWDEKVIDSKLDSIGWYRQKDRSSWRIGDGTSAFYNIAYRLELGWNENDIFRSNQVRSGQLTREESAELLKADNIINIEMLEWYFSILKLDINPLMESLVAAYEKKRTTSFAK